MEAVVCSSCGAEPGDEYESERELELCGWEFTEFGALCPEHCMNSQPSGGVGIDALAEAIGSDKKE